MLRGYEITERDSVKKTTSPVASSSTKRSHYKKLVLMGSWS